MNHEIKQEKINQLAWKACDTFRGVMDPAQYKDYILTFLFLKYVSDVWKDKKEQYIQRYKGDMVRVERAMNRERFIVPEGCTYDEIYEQRNEDNIGEIINKALDAIEEANKGKLENVFRNIDFNSEANLGQTRDRNRRLRNLIEDFHDPKLDMRPSRVGIQDIIGNTYEYLIQHFASDAGKKGGEFYTPAEVSRLLAKLVDPQPGNRIYDPACGSGSLLIRTAREVGSDDYSIYGQEINGGTWAMCKMNMFLHEMDVARIEWGDTLNNPLLLEGDKLMKFDIVVANPPFSLDKWGAENAEHDPYNRFWRGIPPKSKGDYAFITHMIESTVENTGKVGVVVPHGVLFRGGAEGRIRKQLIEENLLEAVIGLPAQLFYGTGIPVAILVFNRGKKTTDVLFIDASREYEAGKKQNKLREEDIEKIVGVYREFRLTARPPLSASPKGEEGADGMQNGLRTGSVLVEKYAYRATIEEIRENEYNLNIPRYVDTFEEEEPVDIPAVRDEIRKIEEELEAVKKEMEGYLDELGF